MDKPFVSVALCTYNGEAFIDEQLRSICVGSVVPDETILCDDGSTDATCDIVLRWAAKEPQIKLLRNQRNLGVTRNFENALSIAKGDYIFLCDQDDVWHYNKVARSIAEMEKRPDLLLLYTNARLVDADAIGLNCSLFEATEISGREARLIRKGDAFLALVRRNLATGATVVLRRRLIEAAFPFPPEWVHDEWLAIIASAIGRIDFLDEKLIDYRQHSANQIGARKVSFSDKVKKAFSPRGDFHRRQVARTELLLERLIALGPLVPSGRIEMSREKLVHMQFRDSLPEYRVARIVPVLLEMMTGRYFRYSTGFRSVMRDLLERA